VSAGVAHEHRWLSLAPGAGELERRVCRSCGEVEVRLVATLERIEFTMTLPSRTP
jgi:hypothetical protein